MRSSKMSSILYWALLGVVCLAPLPLASNRPLPWSVLALAIGALLLVWGLGRLIGALRSGPTRDMSANADSAGRLAHARLVDRYAALLVTGFAILIAWYWVQASPALSGGWAHAAWAEAAAALGTPLPATASLDPAAGETLIMKIVAYGGIFLLAFEMGRDRNRARLGFWAICLSGFAYALYGLFVQFTGERTVLWFAKDAYPDSVTATFINRNAYATYAGMAVLAGLVPLVSEVRRLTRERLTPLRFLLALSERTSPSLYLVIVATITGVVAIALTGSRAGVACFALALVVFAIGLLIAREIRLRTFLVGAALGIGAVVAVLLLSGDFLAKRLMTESAPEARASVFDVARLAVAEEPWIGHGLGAFGPAFNRANDGRAVFETYVDLAHNTYLELAVEGGIPALLLSLALIGGAVGICFAGLLSRVRNASMSVAAVAIATLVGAHATVDFGIQMPAVAATFMLLIGVASAQAMAVEKADARIEGRRAQSQRRFGRGRSRPHRADEAVTPPPELEIAWPVRSTAPVLPAPGRMAAPGALQPLSRMQDDEARPITTSDDASTSADAYEAAMARWRALRRVGVDDVAAPGSTPPGQPGTVSPDAEPPPGDEPPDGSTPRSAKVVKLPRPSRT